MSELLSRSLQPCVAQQSFDENMRSPVGRISLEWLTTCPPWGHLDEVALHTTSFSASSRFHSPALLFLSLHPPIS